MKMMMIFVLLILPLTAFAQPVTIDYVEYYIDTDPGFGNGTEISISPDTLVNFTQEIDLTGVDVGLHRIYVRSRNHHGEWSRQKYISTFIKTPFVDTNQAAEIEYIEYFIDGDPGLGNGTPIQIDAGNMVHFILPHDFTGDSVGVHPIYLRARNGRGEWSNLEYITTLIRTPFMDTQRPGDIVRVEYYIDDDPGLGNGIEVPVEAGDLVTFALSKDLGEYPEGIHRIYVRSQNSNGDWSGQKYVTTMIRTPIHTATEDVTYLEFFFNQESANPTPILITPDSVVHFSELASVENLPEGMNTVTVRGRSALGWGSSVKDTFYVRHFGVQGIDANYRLFLNENHSLQDTFWVYSSLTDSAYVQSISSSNDAFVVDNLPLEIAADDSVEQLLTFEPTTSGVYEGILELEFLADGVVDVYRLPLLGFAHQPIYDLIPDDVLDVVDLQKFLTYFGSTPQDERYPDAINYDYNLDLRIDVQDLNILIHQYRASRQ